MRLKFLLITVLSALYSIGFTQLNKAKPLKVLFIGNSYIYVNELPKICVSVAASTNNSIVFDEYVVGAYTLREHAKDINTITKIKKGNWDLVVLQEQSQLPAGKDSEVERDVYPYAQSLDSVIHLYNPKAKTIFYMTWGRKNGDSSKCATFPLVCTYKGMDSLLALRYKIIAQKNHASVSPVGAAWKYIREHYPLIELYNKDMSHPSKAGSYAAACCFYTMFLKKNPSLIKYNYTLNISEAYKIRNAVKKVVFDDLHTWE